MFQDFDIFFLASLVRENPLSVNHIPDSEVDSAPRALVSLLSSVCGCSEITVRYVK